MVSARQGLSAITLAAVVVACSSNPRVSPTPSGGGVAAAPAPQAPPAGAGRGAAPPTAARGGPPTAGGGNAPAGAPAGRGARLAPDSVSRLRAVVLDSFVKAAAGHENDKAGSYYANVTVLKDQTVAEFLKTMDAYGKAISGQCSSCHVATDYSADTRPNKGRARIMQIMTDVINTDHLPKISPTRPPKATCMTCHHGLQTPNQALDATLQRANEAAGYPPAAPTGGRGGQ